MLYTVECEYMDRDFEKAANTVPATAESRVFDHSQDAVDFARAWVKDRVAAPEGLPRAFVRKQPARGRSKPVFTTFVNLRREYVERRLDGKGV